MAKTKTEQPDNEQIVVVTPEEQTLLESVKYRKSNKLINARGRSSATVHKLFTVAISEAKLERNGKKAVAIIPGTKLRKIFGTYAGSFYNTIRDACNSQTHNPDLLSWRLGIENPDKETFEFVNVVESAKFERGELEVVFTERVTREITGLKANYTEFYRYITLKMRSSYSMVLYEQLSSQADYMRATSKDHSEGPYEITYSIEDLRAIFSLDYQKDKKTVKHLYMQYTDFKKNVLDVAKKEINELTPITVEYKPIRAGRGGKNVGISFTVTRKDAGKKTDAPLSEEEVARRKIVFADVVILLAPEGLNIQDVQTLCQAADYDMERIEKAYNLSKESSTEIKNLTGWLLSAIQKGYDAAPEVAPKKEEPKKKKRGRTKKNSFTDFEQNEYDFDELEQKLLKH